MNVPMLPQIPLIKSVTDLRYKAREIMLSVTQGGKTVLLTKDSDPVAVLFPIELYESIRQYIEDTQDVKDLKNAFVKQEKSVNFIDFDRSMRKNHTLPRYVQNRSSK